MVCWNSARNLHRNGKRGSGPLRQGGLTPYHALTTYHALLRFPHAFVSSSYTWLPRVFRLPPLALQQKTRVTHSRSVSFEELLGDSELLTGRSAVAEINQPDPDPNAAVKQNG